MAKGIKRFFKDLKDKTHPWFKIEDKGESEGSIDIYDDIGSGWFTEGITAKAFKRDIDKIKDVKNLTIRINSNGGEIFTGFTVFELINSHKAVNKTVIVDGIAGSIASVIAMAGTNIVMAKNAFMMIHSPSSFIFGKSDELRKQADLLDKMEENILDSYMIHAKVDKKELQNMLKEETWLNADEAIELGLAHEKKGESEVSAFSGNRYSAFNSIPMYIQNLVNREDAPPVSVEEEDKNEIEEVEMNPEDLQKILDASLKPLTDKIDSVSAKVDANETKITEISNKVSTQTVDKKADLKKRLNTCVSQGKLAPLDRDSFFQVVDSVDTDVAEKLVSGVESRNKIDDSVLIAEVTLDDGSRKSCIVDKAYSLPSGDNGRRIPMQAAIAAFDNISEDNQTFEDFRKKAFAQAGEKVPLPLSRSSEPKN